MSGIPTTSLGNTLRSLSYILFAIRLAKLEYSIAQNKGDCSIYNCGDDLVGSYRPEVRD